MTVEALIQAAGGGSRLGLGPKAFVMLDGRTLLERAIAIFRDTVSRVIVAVPAEAMAGAQALVASDAVTLVAGGSSRSETTRRLVHASSAPWLILHDVAHPFATPGLVDDVLAAARIHRAAAPGIPNTEFMYASDGAPLHAPGELLIGQKPVAFARAAALAAYQAASESPDPSFLDLLARAGIRTRFVPGSPRNIKITSPADLEIAEAMLARERTGARANSADARPRPGSERL